MSLISQILLLLDFSIKIPGISLEEYHMIPVLAIEVPDGDLDLARTAIKARKNSGIMKLCQQPQ